MGSVEGLVARMRAQPKGVRFADLVKVCDHHFGEPRQRGTSHRVYRMPWAGDPRVNIQSDHGTAKAYQVRQVLAAIDRLKGAGHVDSEA
ncbi:MULTISPECIES: toxin HicA [unclassified Microbacterium]|uniref:toxin HicA n=1 Tax=unclassified Microbacterium TaxID=2609290 RepID=UPI00109B7B1D|nr:MULTISPECIES: toxin HicA [unclassified Microbacterium]